MSRAQKRSFGMSRLSVVGLMILVGAGLFVFYKGCVSDSSVTSSETSSSPSPTANSSSGRANPQQSPLNTNTPKAEDEKGGTVVITGTVKRQDSSEPVTGAVVVLFNGDKRGATPVLVDEDGQFQIKDVPIRSGATYSLQTKVPGLCGEESFTSASIVDQKKISQDIVLKPCQSQAPVTVTPTQPELTPISDGLSGVAGSLSSMTTWVQVLAIAWILTLLMLLSGTIGLIIWGRRWASDTSARIDPLYQWKQSIDDEPKKETKLEQPAASPLTFSTEVLETLQQLLLVLTEIAESKIPPPPSGDVDDDSRPQQTQAPTLQEKQVATVASEAGRQDSLQKAKNWYQRLLQSEVPNPPPLYVVINGEKSATDSLAHNRQVSFDEQSYPGPFVVLREKDDYGWIFPRPGSPFMRDHSWVFCDLDQNNFDQERDKITPKEVKRQDGHWLLTL